MIDHIPRQIEAEDHGALIALWHQSWHDAHAALVPKEMVDLDTATGTFPLVSMILHKTLR